jgi:NAD(P)-dependent dehydrogenase (short-subunit alcohol dehydrogenase family)
MIVGTWCQIGPLSPHDHGSEAATQTLSRVAAAEWGPDGIRVITGTTIALDRGQAYLR